MKINKEDGWYIECDELAIRSVYYGPFDSRRDALSGMRALYCPSKHRGVRIKDGKIVEEFD